VHISNAVVNKMHKQYMSINAILVNDIESYSIGCDGMQDKFEVTE
jgi:hypothetical protein